MKSMTRVVSSALAVSLAAVAVGAAPAGASTKGVGTTATRTSVVSFQLGQNGSLLNLGLLTDVGGANIDSHGGALKAASSLVPITLASPALHLDLSTPAIATQSPGGQSDATSQAITLSGLGVPSSIATATIKPALLHSDFTSSAARSTMTSAEVDNLTLLGGGLASVDLLSSTLGADALTTSADGVRGVNIGTVKLLDLGALLRGLGMDLTALPVSSVSSLLSKLGIPLSGIAAGSSLASTVTSLSTALTGLRAQVVGATTTVTNSVDTLTSGALGSLGLPVPAAGTLVTDVNSEITSLQNTLAGLLSSAASALDSFPLIQVSGTQAGIATKAADTVANSAAGVNVTPLKITVAGVTLPALDLNAVASTVNSAVDTANGALNSLLGGVLGLPTNLITVKLLEKATSVTQNGQYTSATAGLSVLHVGLAPIDASLVSSALSKLSGSSITSLLAGTPLGSALGATSAMSAVSSLLGQAAPLLGGAQLQIASLAGASTYTLAPAAVSTQTPAPPTSLPHTGTNPALALFGFLFAALALASVRMWRATRLQPARVSSKGDGLS